MAALLPGLGCSSALTRIPAPAPAEIPALEAELERSPGDQALMVRLGAAYRADEQPERARTILEQAHAAEPGNEGAVFFLGLTMEDLGDPTAARRLYESYLSLGKPTALRTHLRKRLPLLARQELQLAVRQAIASEAALATGGPQQRSLAVFPFHHAGGSAELEPLSRAMAELLVTDLSQTDRLLVLERSRVQFLLDELELSESGLVDPETAARGGRLLGAERLVQGSLAGGSGAEIRLDAAIVSASSAAAGNGGYAAASPGNVVRISESDALQRLFDVEKRLALRIYEAVGIELTQAERERVNRRATENLQALLAYGRGLRAADAGDYATAALHFREAATHDPSFAEAARRAEEAEAMDAAQRESTDFLASLGGFEARLPVAFGPLDAMVPGVGPRDAAQEVLGTEGYEPSTVVEVIINRPAGGN